MQTILTGVQADALGSGAMELLRGLPRALQEQLTAWGLGAVAAWLAPAVIFVGLCVVAAVMHYIERNVFAKGMHRLVQRTDAKWDNQIADRGVFERLAHIIPALTLYFGAPLVLFGADGWVVFTQRLALAYLALVGAWAGSALLTAGTQIYEEEFRAARERPIRSYVQVLRLLLWGFAVILILSALMGRSPWAFLGGLGAMTAILMLVFKDSILGFVASVQIAGNDMVREGDWIEMPDYGADGDVLEISLTTVKVQNWNKTITTIPTYALVSHAFKNWRGMSESEGRRIKRALYIDMESIRFLDESALERGGRVQLINDYLAAKSAEIAEHNAELGADPESPVNGRRLTNVGTFRAYAEAYLRAHPQIHQDMTLLVRQLAPTEKGLPIELYAFSREKRWAQYEALQADIFDHLLAALPEFGLAVVQMPTGADVRASYAGAGSVA